MKRYAQRLSNPKQRPRLGDKIEAIQDRTVLLAKEKWTANDVLTRLIRATVIVDRLGGAMNVELLEILAGRIFDHNGIVFPHHIDKAGVAISWPMEHVGCIIQREHLLLYLQCRARAQSVEKMCREKLKVSKDTNERYRKRALHAIAAALNEREVPLEL